MCADPNCPHAANAARIYAEAAANVAPGISTPTAQVTDVDETTRPRLSRWARRKQRGPVRPEYDPFLEEDRADLFDERNAR